MIVVVVVTVVLVENVKIDEVVKVLTTVVVVSPKRVVAVFDVKIHVEKPVVCRVVVLKEVDSPVVVKVVEVEVAVVETLVVTVVEVCVVTAFTPRKLNAKSPLLPVTIIAYRPGGAVGKTVIEPATNPDEIVHVEGGTVKTKAIGVNVQVVSWGWNPLPEIPTNPPGGANNVLGLIVICAEGAPTWKVAPAKKPFESVTLIK